MRRISLAGFALMLGACSHAPMKQSDTHITAGEPAAPSGSVPAPVQISTILPKPKPTTRPETYSVVVNGVKVQELLFALARDAKLNIDVQSGIIGTVTLNAIDQTLPQLLTRISKQVDMRWELDGPNLVITPDAPFLRIYRVDYVNMERLASGTVGVSSQIGTGGGTAGGGSAGGGGGNSSSTTVKNTSDNKFWGTLEKNIKDILHETDKVFPAGGVPQPAPPAPALSGAPGAAAPAATAPNATFREAASVIVNAEASVIVIRATSRQHEKIQEFLDQVLANVKRQVLIEATIAEVQLSNQYQQGIDWSVLRTRGLTSVGANQISPGNVSTNPNPPPGITVTPPPGGLPSSSLIPNLFTLAASRGTNIAGVLQLLESFGNVRVLSSPKLSVLNNQTALLRVVDNLVYFNVQVTVTPGNLNTNATIATNTTPITVPVGFVMNVTPQISENNTILLNVKPTTTRFVKFVNDPNPDLAKAGVVNQVPQLRMREMESLIKVNSGQIAVLGGLIEDTVNDVEDTIPFINSIPIIGSLFSSRNRGNTKTELVIFLRPVVVTDPSIDGDFRAFRSQLPGEDFISQPNPGRSRALETLR